MIDILIDKRGEIVLEDYERLLRQFPRYAKRAVASAMKSEGFRLKKEIQAHIRSRGAGSWKNLNPHTGVLGLVRPIDRAARGVKNYRLAWKGKKGSKKRVRKYWDWKGSTRTAALSKLASGVRYKYDKEGMFISIGFVNPSSSLWRLMKKNQKGYSTRVTPRMRKFLFAMGFPLKKTTTTLKTPARPVIDPIFEKEKTNIVKNLNEKIFKNIERYRTGSPKK